MCCELWGRGPRRRFARRDHEGRHWTQAMGEIHEAGCGAFFGCLTTPSHVARCARELSGAARRTRNGWSCSTQPCTGHRVEFQGFDDVLRALGRGPRRRFARRDHGGRHRTHAVGRAVGSGKVSAVLCGLRTSVFFVIYEVMRGFSFTCTPAPCGFPKFLNGTWRSGHSDRKSLVSLTHAD